MEARISRKDAFELARGHLLLRDARRLRLKLPPKGLPTEAEIVAEAYRRVGWRAGELVAERGYDEGCFDLPRGPRVFFSVASSDADVRNGGFHQYFFDSTGDLFRHAVSGLRMIDSADRAELFERAASRSPDGVPPGREERITFLEGIDYLREWRPWVEATERAYYALEKTRPLDALLDAFVATRPEDFFLDP